MCQSPSLSQVTSTRSAAQASAKSLFGGLRRIGRRVGLDISRYPPRHPPKYSLMAQISEIIDAWSIDCIVDVGAHFGEFATQVRTVAGYTGPIVSIEPSSESFRILNEKMANDPAWTGQRFAIGSADGEVELNTFESTNLNSIHRQTSLGEEQLHMQSADVEVVPLRRLNALEIPDGKLLLKTDTQGHDLEVLRGAGELLSRTAAVVIEVPVRNLYEGVPALPEILEYLTSVGFELAGLYPVLRDTDSVRMIEFDGLFVSTFGSVTPHP